jgi:hypothetical protein
VPTAAPSGTGRLPLKASLGALQQTAGDIARLPWAAEMFARTFPNQRSTSRLLPAWLLLFGLGGLTPPSWLVLSPPPRLAPANCCASWKPDGSAPAAVHSTSLSPRSSFRSPCLTARMI